MRYWKLPFATALFSSILGCTGVPAFLDTGADGGSGTAAIVGRISASGGAAKMLAAASGSGCPEVKVSVNGAPVSIQFDSDCAFVIDGIQPSPLVSVRVELPDLGVAGTVELSNVASGKLIEIAVKPTTESLGVSVERRATPDSTDDLPEFIDGNNVSIKLAAGIYSNNLTVKGNNFTLTGEAGKDCTDQTGWTVIKGNVSVDGNNATFRNIQFAGSVTLHGNNATFINCCFAGQLVVFGNNTDIGGAGDPKNPDNEQGDDDKNEEDDDNNDNNGKHDEDD